MKYFLITLNKLLFQMNFDFLKIGRYAENPQDLLITPQLDNQYAIITN